MFTGLLSLEAFAEVGASDDAWIYVDRKGSDVLVRKCRVYPNIWGPSLYSVFPENKRNVFNAVGGIIGRFVVSPPPLFFR
jgi:hypothetical protein